MNVDPKGLKFEAWCGSLPAIQTPKTEAGDQPGMQIQTSKQDLGGRKVGQWPSGDTDLGNNALKGPALSRERGWHPRKSGDKVNLQAEAVDSKLKMCGVDTSVTLQP